MKKDQIAVKPPKQKRSRKTREALLDAAERLLRDRPWEEISTVAIMIEAECSNGAIYGRFKNKDALLVELYARHDIRQKERFRKRRSDRSLDNLDLKTLLEVEIAGLIKMYRQNRWLLKAMGVLSRTKPDVVTAEMRAERKKMLKQVAEPLLAFEEVSDLKNAERSVELAIFFVSTILRESILYQGPHFGTLDLDHDEFKNSLVRMALGYLEADSKN